MSNLKEILAKIEQGSSWVSYDRVSGVGPGKVAIKVEPGWMGRLPRETYVAVEKGRMTKLATIVQRGIERVSLDITDYRFDMEGGSVTINATLNSASVKASLLSLSGGKASAARIVSITVNGLSMQVPEEDSRYIVYADPDDPGATGLYNASFVITMPKNMGNDEIRELFSLNGKMVNLVQAPNDIPYIDLDHDFDNVTSEDGMVSINIKSNTEYDIELVCCTCSDGSEEDPEYSFALEPDSLSFKAEGGVQSVVVTADDSTDWRFVEEGGNNG